MPARCNLVVVSTLPPPSDPELELFRYTAPEPDSKSLWRAAPENPVWTGWDVLRIAGVAFLAILFFSMVAVLAAQSAGLLHSAKAGELERDPWIVISSQAAAYACVVAFMYALVRRGYGRRFGEAVRWNWPAHWWAYVVGGVALSLIAEVGEAFLPVPKSLPIDEYFRDAPSMWLMAVFGSLIAPAVEELFFRGFLYPVLARRLRAAAAITLTALAFALLHASQLGDAWAPLLVLFVVGLALTVVRARTRSVAASTLVHMAYNVTLFVALFLETDGFQHLEKMKG